MTSAAAFLAQWTTLSVSRFGDCYVSVQPRGKGKRWEIIALDPNGAMLNACVEAEQAGFLEALSLAVANWEDRAGRPSEEILTMLSSVSGGYGLLQGITDQQKGFMNAQILLPLVRVSQASAIVYHTDPVRKQIGTAFLVKPDLVLTAAHVAMQIEHSDNGEYWTDSLRPGLEFLFVPRAQDPSCSWVTVRPAATNALVRHALPHAIPPDRLDLSGSPPAGEKLDFALIRLAQRVDHVDPVEIVDTASVSEGRACWAFGYPGGNVLMMDVDKVAAVDKAAGRWRHLANAAAGMSGGCCVNDEGQVAGMHEGTLTLPVNGQNVRYNRGISIAAIRAAQCKDGRDPFKQRSTAEGLEFQDAAMVADLFRSGLELAPEPARDSWREQVSAALGMDADSGAALPAFHPWFRRDALERWIESPNEAQRLCMVFGERGTGTSFTARILKTKLSAGGGDLLALNATQTLAIGWEDAISNALGAEDGEFRTAAALARYSDSDALIEELKRRSTNRNRLRYIVLDFGHPDAAFRFEGTPWFDLVVALLHNEWVKVLLIGLQQSDRDALIDQLANNPLTEAIDPQEVEIDHIDRNQFISYVRNLARARGIAKSQDDLRRFADEKLVDFAGSPAAAMQTVAAALTAIVFERGLT